METRVGGGIPLKRAKAGESAHVMTRGVAVPTGDLKLAIGAAQPAAVAFERLQASRTQESGPTPQSVKSGRLRAEDEVSERRIPLASGAAF